MDRISLKQTDFLPEPDLHPIYPSLTHVATLISSNSGLSPPQKSELVAHCLARACAFGELIVLQYLLTDPLAQVHVDLGVRDEDGLGLVSLAIHGFGSESERDVEREECVRLLIAQGAGLGADKEGWTPLHHAALLCPPTLVSHLMTHGCSPFAVTRRGLTPLDVVTAHSVLPGRSDVALLLEEAMRGEGWTGGRMEQKRRIQKQRQKMEDRRTEVRNGISQVLAIDPSWWNSETDSDSDGEEEDNDDAIYTPLPDYSSMLVFSPHDLSSIFDSLITNFRPTFRNVTPANTLYLLARFAYLTCDHTWLEDLITGATDAIEDAFFNRADDLTCLIFWLNNTTIWLHLLQCDNSINEACEVLGFFELIEEVINSVFVFIIRFAERRIDQLFDAALLDYSPHGPEHTPVQFESEWSFLRPFSGKKKGTITSSTSTTSNTLPRARAPSSPPSPKPVQGALPSSSSSSRGISSLRQSLSRGRGSNNTSLSSIFIDPSLHPSPDDITTFLTALHAFLNLSEINPAMTTQLWSQVMYWTSCEIFNRIITRKKNICRSRAVQISMNVAPLEEWIEQMGLPPGVRTHFRPVRDLLNWLQSLSSMTEFSDLVATIQTLKNINPLQMRRAVHDYKYEVNEGRMTEECTQYLTQLQKDWERHRVKLGVEALRKEMGDKDSDALSSIAEASGDEARPPSISPDPSESDRQNVDILFGTLEERQLWEPSKPPSVLGELLDSRYMLPLLFPHDPRMLAALPQKFLFEDEKLESRSTSSVPNGRNTTWRSRNKKLRDIGLGDLRRVDGLRSASRWTRTFTVDGDEDDENPAGINQLDATERNELTINTHITPLTRKSSVRKGRHSLGEDQSTPVDRRI